MVVKKSKKITKDQSSVRKYIRYIFVPLILFAFWMIASYLYSTSKASPTILIHEYTSENILSKKTTELLKTQKITGEFIAKENNLGIVAVRFNTFLRINDDKVRFRIKEKEQKSWYYENDYTTPQFQPSDLFTFGFPIIENSEGKTYIFEIESLQGKPDDAVALSTIEPVFVTKHQYSKEQIKSDRQYLITFVQRKLINTFTNADFLLSFTAYSLPLMLYLIWLFFFEKYLYNKYYLALLPLVLMLITSFFGTLTNSSIVLGLTGLWLAVSIAYRLQTTFSYVISIVFLALSGVLYYTVFGSLSTNFSVWALMLLFSGVILQIEEFRSPMKNQKGFEIYKKYFKVRRK